jgi:hypothetical protein
VCLALAVFDLVAGALVIAAIVVGPRGYGARAV